MASILASAGWINKNIFRHKVLGISGREHMGAEDFVLVEYLNRPVRSSGFTSDLNAL